MNLMLVPHRAGNDSARLWAAAITDGPPPGPGELRLSLSPGERTVGLPAAAWRPVPGAAPPGGGRGVFVQVLVLDGLRPGASYEVRPVDAALAEAGARFSTLPAALPAWGQRPFTLLLS